VETGKEILSFADVLDYLGISRSLLFKLMSEGELPFAKLGRRTIFRRSDVDAFVEKKIVKKGVTAPTRTPSRKPGSRPAKK